MIDITKSFLRVEIITYRMQLLIFENKLNYSLIFALPALYREFLYT